jgi:hypothetical protein
MSVEPFVPAELTHGPSTVADALRVGLTRRQLQSRCWKRLARGRYVWVGLGDDLECRLEALRRGLPPEAVFSHRTAGWLHGLDLEPGEPPEATVPFGCGVSNRAAVLLRRSALSPADVCQCRGLPATSPLRTAFDLARHLPLIEAVMAADAALRHMPVDLDSLSQYIAAHPRAQGSAQARRVVELAEPREESPMESRLRALLVLAGLPRPDAQVEVADGHGHFIGRLDLYYPAQRLGLEYDGDTHRERLVADNRRQNRLLSAGYRLLRFTAADVYKRPAAVVAEVRAALQV